MFVVVADVVAACWMLPSANWWGDVARDTQTKLDCPVLLLALTLVAVEWHFLLCFWCTRDLPYPIPHCNGGRIMLLR